MATINELLLDAAVDHAIDLNQYSTFVVRRLIGVLNRVDADLAAALASALERMSPDRFTVERLEALLKSVRALNEQAYARVDRELRKELRNFAEVESAYQGDVFKRVLPEAVQVKFRVGQVSVEQVYSAALSRPFQGRLLRDWAKKLEADRLEFVRNAIRTGYVSGETTSQIVTRIRGTRANNYADGVLNRSRRDLEAVVDTAVKHTAAVARDKMFEANEDIIAALVWTSTLDTRTSEICVIRADKRYHPVTHKPIGHKIPWIGGPGRAHFRCRSIAVPVMKSWRELGIDMDELTPSTRSSMDGQVPADMTFAQWLEKQSAYRQEQVLGPTRARLMREGGMSLPDFYTASGQYLTLEQLRKRNAAAFERAGV